MMYLSAFSIIEPEDKLYLYYPSWLNVGESFYYKKALKSTHAHGWGFKRFGTLKDVYPREMIRKPQYIKYIDAMEQASDNALQKMAARERVSLMKSRTAFIYVDSWGESGVFEDISSALHTSIIDTLPKNLVKKFSGKEFTCKIRGENNSFMQAMRVAQDHLSWGVFDFVVVCAAYRAIPILVFTDQEMNAERRKKDKEIRVNMSIERVGCFIFSQRESAFKIHCGNYVIPCKDSASSKKKPGHGPAIDLLSFTDLRNESISSLITNAEKEQGSKIINLTDLYGNSGCISPALSWVYLEQYATSSGRMRTFSPNNFGGYNYFDTWYAINNSNY